MLSYLPLARMEVPSNCPVNEFFAGGPLGSKEVRVTVTLGGLTETLMSMVRSFDEFGRTPPPELVPLAILNFRSRV